MAAYKDRLEKNLIIAESSSISGQVIGSVTVKSNVNLQLHGMIVGILILEFGAEVFIHGVMNGNIENAGSLYVFGTVNGTIFTEKSGRIHVDAKATVINQKHV